MNTLAKLDTNLSAAERHGYPAPSNAGREMRSVSTQILTEKFLCDFEARAVAIRTVIQDVLDHRFGYDTHRGRMCPQTLKPNAMVLDGRPFVVTVPVSIFHLYKSVTKEAIMDAKGNTCMAISQALKVASIKHFFVRQLDSMGPGDQGIYFFIILQPLAELAAPGANLPRVAELDLSQRPAGELMIPLGIGVEGPVWKALHVLKHALIVGTSGSGKSTLLHTALAALTTGATPEALKIALIDPKRNEFSVWRGAPHLFGEIAHTQAEATTLAQQLAREADRRGEMMDGVAGVCKDIETYKRKTGQPLPTILCIVDECLDFVGESKAFDDAVKTIAKRGRSAGVFLWMATQHGSAVEGLPRVVKVNMEQRFVFRVADGDAARNAGCPGANLLPSGVAGRMLAKIGDEPVELQGFYLDDAALEAVAAQVCGEQGVQSNAPTMPERLTEEEARLVRYAIEELGGEFSVNRVWSKFKPEWSHHAVDKLARRLAQDGLLIERANPALGRLVTEELEQLAGVVHEGVHEPSDDEYARLFKAKPSTPKA